MARRRTNTQPPPVENRQFTMADIEKLRSCIEEVKGLDPRKVQYDDTSVRNIARDIEATLINVFGEDSQEHKDNRLLLFPSSLFNRTEAQKTFPERIAHTIKRLKELIEDLKEKREDPEADQRVDQSGAPSLVNSSPNTRQVFVVHGRDELAKEKVRTFLDKLDLVPVILDERPSQGQTVIEKFEGNADVAFAVVLFTPDDAGGLADSSNESRPRARQNVIFELGFFVGKLGRKKVCVLHKGDVEIMSDYQGVIYVSMDDGGGWRLKLAQELKSAGIDVDLNRLQ